LQSGEVWARTTARKQAGVAGLLPLHDSGHSHKAFPWLEHVAFRGHFEYSLDAKNRLTIPAKFRASFSDGLVLARWLDPCVAVFTPEGFDRFNDSFIHDMHPLSSERRRLSRFFSGGAFDAELDSAGRVTLGAPLLDHGGITKDVVVIGNVDHLEIWDRARCAADQADLPDQVARIAESLGHPS
jgi:transcriptional regulator MraZ